MAYLFLALAILLESAGTIFMKLSEGFSKLWFAGATVAAYGLCFYFLSLSLKVIPLGVAYAIWAALGIILSNVVGVFLFKQSFDLAVGIGVSLIVLGVVVINLFSSASAH